MTTHSKLTVLVLVAMAFFVAALLDSTYRGRVALVTAQRASCHRGLADRHDNAEAWYAAYLARHRAARFEKPGSKQWADDTQAAKTYLDTARDLNSRTYGNYAVTLAGTPPTHPLGRGTLNCARAFPMPSFIDF